MYSRGVFFSELAKAQQFKILRAKTSAIKLLIKSTVCF